MQVLWVLDIFLQDFVIMSTSIISFLFVFWWRMWVMIQHYFNEAWSLLFEKTELVYWIMDMQIMISEKAMAPHYSTLAWRIPGTEEPGRRRFMRSPRVRHDWATSLSLFTFMHWRRKWQPTPVFLPGESQGWRNLVGCRLWGRTELDTTEVT